MRSILILLLVSFPTGTALAYGGAYEDYLEGKIIVFYECFQCTDLPFINNPAYAVQFDPLVTVDTESELSRSLKQIIAIDHGYDGNGKRIVKRECAVERSLVKLMVIGLEAHPILVDVHGCAEAGNQTVKLSMDELDKLHALLWPYKDDREQLD